MKYCEEYAALLDLFVDGELPSGEMERVRAHLKSCPACQAYVDDALAIRAAFPDAEDTIVPEDFTGSVMERVRKSAERDKKAAELKRRSVRRWAGTLTALAACCALVILIQGGAEKNAMMEAVDTAGNAGWASAASEDGGEPEAQQIMPEEAVEGPVGGAGSRMAAYLEDGEEKTIYTSGAERRESEKYDYNSVGAAAAAAPPELAAVEGAAESAADCTGKKETALYLSAGEAEGLLDGFTPVREDGGERSYELTAGEFQTLLEALGRKDEWMEPEGERILVVVTGPFE